MKDTNSTEQGAFYLVAQKQLRTDKNGSAYLTLTLSDRTGPIEARMWNVQESLAARFEQGDVVKVLARVEEYRGQRQLKIETIERARQGDFELSDLLPATTKNVDELWAELATYVESFTNPHLKALLQSILNDEKIAPALRSAPAAKSLHHAWISGLLEHIVSLLGISDLAASHYKEINRDLLLTGVVLHDIGKLVELSWKTGFDYTMEGQLLGHITIGVGIVTKKIDALPEFPPRLKVLVLHMILSHHGKYEFGSPKLPMIPEALLLNFLDDMDAKLQTMRTEFERNESAGRPSGQMTDWVRAMERQLLSTQGYLGEDNPGRKDE